MRQNPSHRSSTCHITKNCPVPCGSLHRSPWQAWAQHQKCWTSAAIHACTPSVEPPESHILKVRGRPQGSPPHIRVLSRPYNDYDGVGRVVIVRAGAVEWMGAGTLDPCGRPRTSFIISILQKELISCY